MVGCPESAGGKESDSDASPGKLQTCFLTVGKSWNLFPPIYEVKRMAESVPYTPSMNAMGFRNSLLPLKRPVNLLIIT